MLMKQLSKGPTMLTDPFKAKQKIFTFCENMRRFEICVILTHRVTPCHTDFFTTWCDFVFFTRL